MNRRILGATTAALLLLFCFTPAFAAERVVLMELFTNTG